MTVCQASLFTISDPWSCSVPLPEELGTVSVVEEAVWTGLLLGPHLPGLASCLHSPVCPYLGRSGLQQTRAERKAAPRAGLHSHPRPFRFAVSFLFSGLQQSLPPVLLACFSK